MNDPAPQKRPYAGGFLIVVGIFAGTAIGATMGQPILGFVAGLAVGAILAVALYLMAIRGR